jgi:hypothetical protein
VDGESTDEDYLKITPELQPENQSIRIKEAGNSDRYPRKKH